MSRMRAEAPRMQREVNFFGEARRMGTVRAVVIAVFSALLLVASPLVMASPAASQEVAGCGKRCQLCGWDKTKGVGDGDRWEKGCEADQDCSFCEQPAMVGEATPTEEQVVTALDGATEGDLNEVVAEYGEYLLLYPARNMLAIQGVGCDPSSIASVVFLSAGRSIRLRALGVQTLQ